MAKSKPAHSDPTIQPHDPRSPEEVQDDAIGDEPKTLDLADEVAKLKAELAAKTAEADDASAKLAALTAAPAPVALDGPKRKFVVAVTDAPTWCVEAVHESLAFAAYCKASGMISTPHVPSVVAVADNHPLGKAPFAFPGPGEGLPK